MKQLWLKSALLFVMFVCSSLLGYSQTLYEKELPVKISVPDVERQASEGNVVAMYRLAYWYRWGQAGYNQDFGKAMSMCLKLSDFGYPFAQDLIGNMYVTGSGVECNRDIAREWYSKAFENLKIYADRGNVDAMAMLAYVRCSFPLIT